MSVANHLPFPLSAFSTEPELHCLVLTDPPPYTAPSPRTSFCPSAPTWGQQCPAGLHLPWTYCLPPPLVGQGHLFMPIHTGLGLVSSLFSIVLANVQWNYSQGLQTLWVQLECLCSEVQAFCTITLEQVVFHQHLQSVIISGNVFSKISFFLLLSNIQHPSSFQP